MSHVVVMVDGVMVYESGAPAEEPVVEEMAETQGGVEMVVEEAGTSTEEPVAETVAATEPEMPAEEPAAAEAVAEEPAAAEEPATAVAEAKETQEEETQA